MAILLLAFTLTACNEVRPAPSSPQAIPQVAETPSPATHQAIETIQTPTEEEEPAPTPEPISLFEAILRAEIITEIEMVFVEGGTMTIQGQKITLDSFYISKFVVTCHVRTMAHNWAHERGYLGDLHPWSMPNGGCVNSLMGWSTAIALSNWLSIMNGFTPVYWREGRTEPVLSPWHTIEMIVYRDNLPTMSYHSFFIDWDADGFRLPTEAEWEFAARGGNKSRGYRYAGSDILSDVLSSFRGTPLDFGYIPGQMRPNELGIHDMSNTASEWVIGQWTEYGELEPTHNPGRVSTFIFEEPVFLLQKGGNTFIEFFRPEERISFNADLASIDFDREIMAASVRLVRRAGLQ